MTLPRKFTRPIVVDGIRYRWMLKDADHGGGFELLLVVEANDHLNGEQLIAQIPMRARAQEDAITPVIVAELIRDARGRGWDPERPGSRVDCDDKFLELVQARRKPPAIPRALPPSATGTIYRSTHRCTQCGGVAEQAFAEELQPWGLSWWESWHCIECGQASEAHGRERLSDDLREIVLRAEGSFRVDVVPRDKIGLLRIL